jgi:hypothetical protein
LGGLRLKSRAALVERSFLDADGDNGGRFFAVGGRPPRFRMHNDSLRKIGGSIPGSTIVASSKAGLVKRKAYNARIQQCRSNDVHCWVRPYILPRLRH